MFLLHVVRFNGGKTASRTLIGSATNCCVTVTLHSPCILVFPRRHSRKSDISAVRPLRGSTASNLPTTNNSFSPAIRLMSDASLWAELLITRHSITSPLPNRTARWHQYGHTTTLSSCTLKKLFRDNHSRCLVSAFENTLNTISQAHFTLNKKNTK